MIYLRAILLTLIFSASCNAAKVNFNITGEITSADINNPFLLSIGDSVSITGMFDDSDINEYYESYIDFSPFSNYGSNYMAITIGDRVYTDEMEYYGGGILYFYNGVFQGVNYISLDNSFDARGFLEFDGTGIEGSWDAASFETYPVPVPAAIWLFWSGFIGLAGIARRKNK